MPTDPYAIPQVALNNLQHVGPVISPMQGLREIIQAYATINRMNRMASGGGRGRGGSGWSGVPGEYSGVGNPSKGRWVKMPNGKMEWAAGTNAKDRDKSEAELKSAYARDVLAKDEKYQKLIQGDEKTPSFEKLSVPGKRERMQQVREHMAEIAPALGMNPQQSVMLGTAGMAENIAAREKAIKDTSSIDTIWDSISRGFTNFGRAISTIGATPQEKQAAARASNQEAQEAAANNVYLDELNRRSEEGRSTLGMRLRPTGLMVTLGESLPGLGGTIAAQGVGGALGGLAGGFFGGPAGAAAGSTLGQTVGRFAGAALGGAAAAGPLSEYSNVQRIEASDMSDAEKLAAIEKSNAGWYGAAVGAIPVGPAAATGMALRQIPRAMPRVGVLSRMAKPAQTYTGGVVKGLVPNAIDAAALGAGFNVAGNLAYNSATGQNIPWHEGLREAITEGAILGLPMAFMGARGTAGRYNAWDTRNTTRETNIANRQAVDTLNRQISEVAANQPHMLNEGVNLELMREGSPLLNAMSDYNNALDAQFRNYAMRYGYGNARNAYANAIDAAARDAIGRNRGQQTVSGELNKLHDIVSPKVFEDQLRKTITFVPPENRDSFLLNIVNDPRFSKPQRNWTAAFRQKMQDPNEPKPVYIKQTVPAGLPENKPIVLGQQNFDANTPAPAPVPAPIPKALNEKPLTNTERNALRSIKQQDVFFTELGKLLDARTPEAQQKVLADIKASGKFAPIQKDWADTYRRTYIDNGKQSAEGSEAEQTAGLGRAEQPGKGNINPEYNNTGSTAATDTQSLTPPPADTTITETPTGNPATETGRNDGAGPQNTGENKTPERVVVEQGTGGTDNANGKPGAIPATDVSAKPGEGAGGDKLTPGTGERRTPDETNVGEQPVVSANELDELEKDASRTPVTPNEKSVEIINELAAQDESFNETRAEVGITENKPISSELVDFTSAQIYDAFKSNKGAGRNIKDENAAINRAYDIYSKLASGVPLKDLSKTEQSQYKVLRNNGLPDYKDAIPEAVVEYSRAEMEKGDTITHLYAPPGEKGLADFIKSYLMNKYNRDRNVETPIRKVCW